MPALYRVYTLPTPRDYATGWCTLWGACCPVGAASGGALGLVLVHYYLGKELSELDVQDYKVEMLVF